MKKLVCIMAFATLSMLEFTGNAEDLMDWENMDNPVYFHEGWSTKDACMTYRDGTFYVFFSAFFFDEGRERSHVSAVKTKDFQTFSEPLFIWDGMDDGWIGMCSPNITRVDDTYYLTYNSWGDDHPNGSPNQLFYAESKDLENWDKHKPLATNVTVDEDGGPRRAIDAAVTYDRGKYYLVWKAVQTPQIAWSNCMGADGWTTLGRPIGSWFENGEFLKIDGRWHMLVTANPPGTKAHLPHLVPMINDGSKVAHWLGWGQMQLLDIPQEEFNTNRRANASFLADWREHDGYFYLLYAGRTESESHLGRGDNKLGLARSKDLKNWTVPGE